MNKVLPLIGVLLLIPLGSQHVFAGNMQDFQEIINSLYDIDFGTPPHMVGFTPSTGAGPFPRDTVSAIPFGNPLVVSSFGDLTNQPLLFDSTDTDATDRITLLTDAECKIYRLETEMYLTFNPPSGDLFFIQFLESNVNRRIDFATTGELQTFIGTQTAVGTYPLDQKFDFRVDYDVDANTWALFVDGAQLHQASLGSITKLDSIILTTNTGIQGHDLQVALDNIKVSCITEQQIIGGKIIPIETTALLLAGLQSATWIAPILISVIGIGLVFLRKNYLKI